MALRTDYANAQYEGLRKYKLIDNGDGTVSFQDVTDYETVGDTYGAPEINSANAEINAKMPMSGGEFTGDVTFDKYASIKAWPGYGSGMAMAWYNGGTKTLDFGGGVENIDLNATSATKATQDKNGNAIDETYVKNAGGTMSGLLKAHGGISLNDTTPNQTPEFILGIKAFADGGNIIWQSRGNVRVGMADSADSATNATNADRADTLDGLHASHTVGANTVVTRESNGYTFLNYINSNTGNNENPTISQVIVTNGGDNYYRKASLAHLKSALKVGAPVYIQSTAPSDTTGLWVVPPS